MRVALHIIKQRRNKLRRLIRLEGFMPLAGVCRRLGISEATARRDLAAIAAKGHITRTRGGGLVSRNFSSGTSGPRVGGKTLTGKGPRDHRCGFEAAGRRSHGLAPTQIRTTLRDIAEKTGFAKTTVSLSLHNHPKIPEATRRIVRAAAMELDYRPDPALARIAEHRWRTKRANSGSTIAFVTTPNPGGRGSVDSRAMAGAQVRAKQLGYGLEHFRLDTCANAARLGSVLFHRGIRGVIVGQVLQRDFCDRFPWDLFSAVGCNMGQFRPPVHIVVPDNAHAVMQAWQRAVSRGFKHIGVALFEETNPAGDFDRTCAALHCQARLPPGEARVPILHVQPNDKAGFLRWMERHRPEMLMGSDNAFYWWLREAGYRIPKDIGFASLAANSALASDSNIAGIDCNIEMIGQAAVEQLDILIRTNQVGIPGRSFALMVESDWVQGETLGNVARRMQGQPALCLDVAFENGA